MDGGINSIDNTTSSSTNNGKYTIFHRYFYYTVGMIILLIAIIISIISFVHVWKRANNINFDHDSEYTGAVILRGGHKIFEKFNWGGRYIDYGNDNATNNDNTNKKVPFSLIRITQTGPKECDTYATCSTVMQELQSYEVNHGGLDIVWNFVIGGDGNVYVGRNWTYSNYDDGTLDLGTIGNVAAENLPFKMKEAILGLIEYGVIIMEIESSYEFVDRNFNTIANFSENL